MNRFFRIVNSKTVRFIWVILPIILFCIGSLWYFSIIYTPAGSQIDLNNKSSEFSQKAFDSYEIRDILPNSLGGFIKFVLCVSNNNRVSIGGNLLDPNSLPNALEETKMTIGAMSIHASLIPDSDLQLYKKRGQSECIPIDMDKLSKSKVTVDVNNGLALFKFSQDNVNELNAGQQTQVATEFASIDLKESHLYARMQWNHYLLLCITIIISWLGLVLLLKNITAFINGSKE